MFHENNDLAIILAWPDATIRGDERWMMLFKRFGIVKNLNFKVGHTGIILIEPHSKALLYYDFGRYIAPRGYGRARSADSDPRLKIKTRAMVDSSNKILNLKEIVEELELMKAATQGDGRLFFSVASGLSFTKAKAYADELVQKGSMLYGAIARRNNNCSRFITRLLVHASKKYHIFHGIRYPETIKSSPLSNVVNARKDRFIHYYDIHNGLRTMRMSRTKSLLFLLAQLKGNFWKPVVALLPDDSIIGSMDEKFKPMCLPKEAQWLGGVGEGAWYHIRNHAEEGCYIVARFTEHGEEEYRGLFKTSETLDVGKPLKIEYDSHFLFTTVSQRGRLIRMYAASQREQEMNETRLDIEDTGS